MAKLSHEEAVLDLLKRLRDSMRDLVLPIRVHQVAVEVDAYLQFLETESKRQKPQISLFTQVSPHALILSAADADKRIRELMCQVGMPDSLSLYEAFKQLWNEIEQKNAKIQKLEKGEPS